MFKNGLKPEPSPSLEVVSIVGKGRGVLAATRIEAGTLIERAPVKPFDNDQSLPDGLADLPFAWTDEQDCIALGCVQLVNHDDHPNCRVERDLKALTISLVAEREILAGEELTFKYKCPLWFEQGNGRTEGRLTPLQEPEQEGSVGQQSVPLPSPLLEEVDALVERLEKLSMLHPSRDYLSEAATALRQISKERDELHKKLLQVCESIPDIWGIKLERELKIQEENARLREALEAMMARFKDDEEAWDAGPCECWVKARAALSTGGEE